MKSMCLCGSCHFDIVTRSNPEITNETLCGLQMCRDSVVPIFAELFVALALVYGDSEQNIRNGAEQIDRALKVGSSLHELHD